MRTDDVRNWLGLYVFVLTVAIGGYLLVAPQIILPLESNDRVASVEIVVPFLLGQVALVFKFYSDSRHRKTGLVDIPAWVVKAPPVAVTILLLVEFALMGVGGVYQATWTPAPDAFRGVLTFSVAVLNGSMVYVLGRYFETRDKAGGNAS